MTRPDAPRRAVLTLAALLLCGSGEPARAQEGASDKDLLTKREFAEFLKEYRDFREEYVKTKQENEQLKSELAELRERVGKAAPEDWRPTFDALAAQERESILEEVREEIRGRTEPLLPGMTNLAIGGGAVFSYQDRKNVDSTFGLGFAPTILWKPTDRLLFETQIALALTDEETEVELHMAQFSYLLNDYLTVGAGRFFIPFGTFWERWHPSWVNKAATMPLIYERGLVGSTGLGVQLRGGAPIGKTKINYAAYFVNGPDFETSFASAGHLGLENFRDNNNDKSFGGRVGFLPIPELEFGYSFLTGRVGDSGSSFSGVDTFIHGVDLSYAREFERIKGRLDVRAEAIWVDTDRAIFTGPFDPFTFDNKRNGWFLQAAYRPTKVDLTLGPGIELKNVEFVVRYDQLRESGPGPLGADRDRLTLGFDYWIQPHMVVKTAYSHDNAKGDEDEDGIFLQIAVGF